MKKGIFITFEGPEGCGKTTHTKMLKRYLEKSGRKVLLTREPGGTKIGKKIRDVLLRPQKFASPYTEALLFMADRLQHVEKIILPALRKGVVVISDRYVDSTVAYQIGARGLSEEVISSFNKFSSRGVRPELTFVLDVSAREGLRRARLLAEEDRFESEPLNFHQRVRNKYHQIAKKEPQRVKLIGTARTILKTQGEIRKIIDRFLRRSS